MSYFSDASLVFIPSAQKSGKAYSVKPTDGTGDLTFTRSNDTATRVGPDGLIEKVRTNLILQSNSFDTTWASINTTETSGAADFDGGNNAWTLAKTAAGGKVTQNLTSLPAKHCFSVYAKAGTLGQIALETSNVFSIFDLSTGVVVSGGGVIQSVGGGWYRCSVTDTPSSNGFTIYPAPTGDASGNIIIYKAQVEAGDIATDPILTTSAAVSVGPVANVPRLDYLNSSCPRLLLEPQRTNLVTYSEQINNWQNGSSGGTAVVTANYGISPDGTQNAERIQLDAGSGYGDISQFISVTNGTVYTYSVYVKSLSGTPTIGLIYDGSSSITQQLTTEWVRYSFTFTGANGFCIPRFLVWPALIGGSSTADILVYGAQLEAGAYATSYIPTLGSASTRGSDAASKTGISSLIGQTEGTLFLDFIYEPKLAAGETTYRVSLSDGTYSNRGTLIVDASANTANVVCGSVVTPSTNLSVGQRYKVAFSYKTNDFAFYVNGSQVSYITSGASIPASLTQFQFSDAANIASRTFAGPISQTLIFKTRLTNAQLAELTA